MIVAVLAGWSAGDQFHRYIEERDQALGTPLPGSHPPPQYDAQAPPGFYQNRPGPNRRFPPDAPPRTPEERFLDRLYVTLIIAVLAAGGVGTVLGLGISRTIVA